MATRIDIDDLIEVAMDDIVRKISEMRHEDFRDGATDYAYVRIWPDGSLTWGREVDQQVPISEYTHQAPHPLTVWSVKGYREACPADQLPDASDHLVSDDEAAEIEHKIRVWSIDNLD